MKDFKTTSFWFYDGKYYKAVSTWDKVGKTELISKTDFYKSIQGLDSSVSSITRIETYSKTERINGGNNETD